MTAYPYAIDDDRSILRIDDNISTLGTEVINQLRSAVFAIERSLGLEPGGSLSSLDERVSVSLNEDGTLKGSAIAAAGLISLPIVNSHIANNAGIQEFKLDLDVSTASLQAQINAVDVVSTNAASLAFDTATNLSSHIVGVYGRHDSDQIDLTTVLFDKDGIQRAATQVDAALTQINVALTTHENLTLGAHPASSITVSAVDWRELPADSENVQEVLDFIDSRETVSTGVDRATLGANGIPRNSRVERINLDGYAQEVVPETRVTAFLAEPSQLEPRDSITNGDDVISFLPADNSDYSFDSLFTQVRIGDVVRVNYGNGISGMFKVSSVRFTPGTEWVVRINGYNLTNCDGDTDGYAYARIDRSLHDTNTYGVLAVAGAYADVVPSGSCTNACDSIIIGSPRGAMALGLGFDRGAFNANHYKLWLRLYPGGNPDLFTDLSPIDVTGNAGITPGAYSLENIVETTNRAFRASGYNYRFIAFQHNGEFGIMLADSWNNASFSIITGTANGTSVAEGMYTQNVVGDATDGYDGLGFGASKAVVASPVNAGFSSSLEAANFSTIIHQPIKGKNYISDGSKRDFLRTKAQTVGDGYWEGVVQTTFDDIPNNTITSTYRINEVLFAEELKPGKSLVIQPQDPTETDLNGYGRFMIGDVTYNEGLGYTDILVINACHATVNPRGTVLAAGTPIRLYFTEDSVGFNVYNLASQGDYHRYHEIFISPTGDTQAIERARIIKQSVDTDQLNTDRDNWQIRNVSPKLKGVRVDDTFRYWKRLYILNYDVLTGEYDGYIGEPPDLAPVPGIVNPGPITRGTKNKVVRFYDASYVSYIDIEFRELSTGPSGTTIADNPPQYIDIEIFPSMVLDDEVMRIAGVSHNENSVGSITDLRDFGTTSEENFTDSAISFIEAGERYLHANGVVRGFDYTGPGVNAAVLTFTGGIGLVNGSFVATDMLSCTIPEIKDSSVNLNFFICLTNDGTLRAIPENEGQQFFDSSTGEFIESFTFTEIVDSHKELLVLYVAAVTIGSVVVNSITDVKRFVTNESIESFSVNVVSPGEIDRSNATFKSLEALEYWVNEYGISEVQVKHITIDTVSSLTFTSKVRLYGSSLIDQNGWFNINANFTITLADIDSCGFLVTSAFGLILGSGARANFCSFIYTPVDPGYIANDMVNINLGYCAYVSTNTKVTDCVFTSTSVQRPPFVYNTTNEGSTLQDVVIERNRFLDSAALDNSAICLQHNDTGGLTAGILRSVSIVDNDCNANQNIVLAARGISNIGWRCLSVEVRNNKCGIIGYMASSVESAVSGTTNRTGLLIVGNNCSVISTAQTVYSSGHFGIPDSAFGSGHVVVKDNTVSGGIYNYVGGASSTRRGSQTIEENTVYAESTALTEKWFGTPTIFSGIRVSANNATDDLGFSLIKGNKIYITDAGTGSVTNLAGIRTSGNANIVNNFIDIVTTASFTSLWGIAVSSQAGDSNQVTTQGNHIYRNGNDVTNYIYYASATVSGMIVDNFIDSPFVTGTTFNTAIVVTGTDVLVTRNKNHRVQSGVFWSALGNFMMQNALYPAGTSALDSSVSGGNSAGITFNYAAADPSVTLNWIGALYNIIPLGTTLIATSLSWATAASPTAASSISIGGFDSDGNPVGGAADLDVIAAGSFNLTAWPSASFICTRGEIVRISATIDSGNANFLVIGAGSTGFVVTYQW